mmetsp:Transcript_124826/g.312162  ORF Transcript_124826/g.312162 Transcript_124826/m.312162 type:complete len:214 (-) Transcript_124826:4382-5023(-)
MRRVFQGHPPGLAVLFGLAPHAHDLQRRLPARALEDLQHLAGLQRPGRLAARLHLLLQAGAPGRLAEDHVRLGCRLQEGGAAVALQRHPALGLVQHRSALHPLEAHGLVGAMSTQYLQELALVQLAEGAASLHLEVGGEGDVLHAPLVLLEHRHEPEPGEASRVVVEAEVELTCLQPALALQRLQVAPDRRGGHRGGALAQLGEQCIRCEARF